MNDVGASAELAVLLRLHTGLEGRARHKVGRDQLLLPEVMAE